MNERHQQTIVYVLNAAKERVAWLLSGAYKVLRSIPRRDFIKRVEEEEDEPNKRLERWLG